MNPGEVIGVLLCGLGILLLVGGLLALFLYLLPTFLNWANRSGRPLKPSELPEPLNVSLMPAEDVGLPLSETSGEVGQPASAAEVPDLQIAAAVGLALALYWQTPPDLGLARPYITRPASPWSLAGRWQAMNARLNLRKR